MKKAARILPEADPWDTPQRRMKEMVHRLPSVARRVWLEKMPELQQPTPFELASLAAAMPANSPPQKRVSSAYELWEESCKFLAPKKPPIIPLDDFLRLVLPQRSPTQRMDLLRGLLASETFSKSVRFSPKPLMKEERDLVEQASAENQIQTYATNGVEYPLELADKLKKFDEIESTKKKIARAQKGGQGKAQKQQEKVNTQKTKNVLVEGNLAISKNTPPASRAGKQASKKWASRK